MAINNNRTRGPQLLPCHFQRFFRVELVESWCHGARWAAGYHWQGWEWALVATLLFPLTIPMRDPVGSSEVGPIFGNVPQWRNVNVSHGIWRGLEASVPCSKIWWFGRKATNSLHWMKLMIQWMYVCPCSLRMKFFAWWIHLLQSRLSVSCTRRFPVWQEMPHFSLTFQASMASPRLCTKDWRDWSPYP